NHLKRCISGNTILNEHATRNEILKSIDTREFQIWQYKQYILQEEAKINRLRLELFSQSTSDSENDKLASVSYDYDTRS
ncbi:7051_t:CDS:1, partial [Rhizophagus irregularis]